MKPRIFIGSSTEGRNIAEHVQLSLNRDAEVTVWHQGVFGLSEGYLSSLVKASVQYDFAILVVTADDTRMKRGVQGQIPRDNVIFEMGLFMGALGPERTFLMCPHDKAIDLPTDLAGISVTTYGDRKDGNLYAAVGAACTQIRDAIAKAASKPRLEAERSFPGEKDLALGSHSQPPHRDLEVETLTDSEETEAASNYWQAGARRLLELLEGEDGAILEKIFRDTVPHKLARWIKQLFKLRDDQQREKIHDLLERTYKQHRGGEELSAQLIRQNCCYYMCFLRTPFSIRFLEQALKDERSLLVRRGIIMGIAAAQRDEGHIQNYLEELRTNEQAASLNAGYHQCYYGDRFFPEGCLFDPTAPSNSSVDAIFSHLKDEELSSTHAVDLFTLRYLLMRGSISLLTPERRRILDDILRTADRRSYDVKSEVMALQHLLEAIRSVALDGTEKQSFLAIPDRYIKRMITAAQTKRLHMRYKESIYIDGKFYLASKISGSAFAEEVERDKAKAARLVAMIRDLDVIRHRPQIDILELGCSYGSFLDAWRKSGWGSTAGIDLSGHAVEFGQALFPDLTLTQGDATTCSKIALCAPVNMICCLDFLEHCFDIDFLLDSLATTFLKGTLLLLYMPFLENIGNDPQTLLQNYKYRHDDHVWYFTRRGLNERLSRFGFRELCFQSVKQNKILGVFEMS
jgi:2-polyprenyl-3-methyl-5-hydroxy-6-metoxy-1,4-benzoquinol methylase